MKYSVWKKSREIKLLSQHTLSHMPIFSFYRDMFRSLVIFHTLEFSAWLLFVIIFTFEGMWIGLPPLELPTCASWWIYSHLRYSLCQTLLCFMAFSLKVSNYFQIFKIVSCMKCWVNKASYCCVACRCIEVAGAYAVQKKDVNISLTSIGALWTTADFFARGVNHDFCKAQGLSMFLSRH